MARNRRLITGRPVMITGAASGIGRSLAQRLSRSGSAVAIADIDEAGLKDTAKSLPGPVLMRVLDVRDAAGQHRFAAEVREWLTAPLAAVFNNAGVAVASSVLDADPGDDEWLRQINFDGVVNGTRAFLPILVEQDGGVIVNTSSVFGLLGMPYQSAYCASKFAVRGFTDALRQELRGTGVSAVTVHPGGITTNIARNARVRKDPEGRGRSHEQMAADFEAITMTTPDKAAEIICRGVERGKARILVGPDAYVFDALARVAPTHYYDVLARFEKRLRSRQTAADERARRRPDRRGRTVRDRRRTPPPAALPAKTYAILEARDAIGGTWDLFRYPGVRSDSDMHTLGYRFRPWTQAEAIADGPSILGYVRDTAAEAAIDKHIRFNHRVTQATWSTATARWTVQALHGTETRTLSCDSCLCAAATTAMTKAICRSFLALAGSAASSCIPALAGGPGLRPRAHRRARQRPTAVTRVRRAC